MFEAYGVLDLRLYALGAVLIVLTPGPNMLYVLKTAVTEGRRQAFAAVGAVLLGDSILIFLAYLGIAAAIKAHPEVFAVVRTAGGLYLAWIGGRAVWDAVLKPRLAPKATAGEPAAISERPREAGGTRVAAPISSRHAFRSALLLSLTNPKSILFYVAFFVQFIDETYPHPWISYLIRAAILQVISVCVLTFLVTVGAGALRRIARRPWAAKLGSLALGTLFLFFAAKLIFGA